MAIDSPVGGTAPPTMGAAPSIRRAIALPLNEDDSGGGAASALLSAGQAARSATATAGDGGSATGGRASRSGGTATAAVPATFAPSAAAAAAATASGAGEGRSGRLFRGRSRRQQTAAGAPGGPGLTVVPPTADGEGPEGRLAAAAAEGAVQNRPGRTATGHGGPRRGKWPLMAAAFAGAMLVSVPLLNNNPGTKTVTGLDELNSTADAYASDMPTHEPQDGAATPLVPEPEPNPDSGAPLLTSVGPTRSGPSGDTTLDDNLQTVPGKTVPGSTLPGSTLPGTTGSGPAEADGPAPVKGGAPGGTLFGPPSVLGVPGPSGNQGNGKTKPGKTDDTDSGTSDSPSSVEAPAGELRDDAVLQPTRGRPLIPAIDAIPATESEPKAQPKAQPKAEPKAQPKAQSAAAPKSAPKAEPKAQPKAQPQSASKTPIKAETRAATDEPAAKPVAKPEPKPAPKPKPKPAPKPVAKPATPDWSTRVVSGTYRLDPGQSVASNRMKITLRGSGDLVITDENGVVRWSSGTSGSGNRAVFQADGHFVVYSSDDKTLWSSGTAGNPGARLVIQEDGNVTILGAGGGVLWSAGTQH
ncbi:hypothetical protein AB0D49_26710 [Streptomyces sp. NPDC048290]|uniref:hypothetical protein n=1 Tax=Streptomyces sp. NPDC048290 TaxID=3155811 RepID=UPI00341369AD